MTADFALSLSLEGIDLLHRDSTGWRRAGHVDVASPTLDDDLAALRKKALTLAPQGFATRIVIPNDQIKYLSLPTADATLADVHQAIEGLTPYSLLELVIDHVAYDGQTHVAAVARETLAEAEGFADGHGFRPVAFVAVAPEGTFPQEVFFGPTEIMTELLGPDGQVLRGSPPVALPPPSAKRKRSAKGKKGTAKPKSTNAIVPPAMAETEPSPKPLTAPKLFDRVIAEVYRHPKAPQGATAHVANAPSPKPEMRAAPASPQAVPAGKNGTPRKLIAAGLAAAVLIGGGVWALLPQGDGTVTTLADVAPEVGTAPATVTAPEVAALPTLDIAPTVPPAPDTQTAPLIVAEADPPPTAPQGSDIAPADAPQVAVEPEPRVTASTGRILTPDEARAVYEATGVWLRAPRFFDTPSGTIPLDFAPPATVIAPDAARQAPPFISADEPEVVLPTPVNPPAPGVTFARDADGFVLATPEGAMTPDGVMVFAGLPDIEYAPRPADLPPVPIPDGTELLAATEDVVVIAGAPDVTPPVRPDGLAPGPEEAEPETDTPTLSPGSVGIAALEPQASGALGGDPLVIEGAAGDGPRPRLRPAGLAPVSETAADDNTSGTDITDVLQGVVADDATLRFDNSTALAVTSSERPRVRPDDLDAVAAAVLAQRTAERLAAAAAANAPAAAPSPDTTSPEEEAELVELPAPPTNVGPVPGGVARAATVEDAIRLREINLIGVYGRPNARRALVRLGNGQFVRVEVGSELDGGQVTAIGDNALNYVKRGRTYAIQLPDT